MLPNRMISSITTLAAVGLLASPIAFAASDTPTETKSNYSPYVNQDMPDQVYFGDCHVHTSYSADSGMIGNKLGPEEAYRFAKGEEVTASYGVKARLQRPLDWMAITDHAEGMGIATLIAASDPVIMKTEFGQKLHKLYHEGTIEATNKLFNTWLIGLRSGSNPYAKDPNFSKSPWEEIQDAAEAANDPGNFSTLIGFEWSSAPKGNNLHRVVIFRDGKKITNQRVPLPATLGYEPEDLWTWMESYMSESGATMLAIPHNGNLSNGWMFSETRYTDKTQVDKKWAKRRHKLEPLYEVTQMKGDAEAHPLLSPDDEFADFETWDKSSLLGPEPKTPDMLPREYAREALKRGLALEEKWDVNPYKFGLVGATDTHTSLSTTQEDNFFGKVAVLEPAASHERFNEVVAGRLGDENSFVYARQTSASGLTAVWAPENTREAIYDAMARKEVYATTGTRLKVRVFAGYNFKKDDLYRSNFAKYAYANGVPMGGDLTDAPKDTVPTLLVKAIKDSDGANLDRIQVIKGWLDAKGKTHEQIYDIACGGSSRTTAGSNSCNKVGNTVDEKSATYRNSIGSPLLEAFWQDPDFDAKQSAFYYVRVIEIPTPRWTTYDAKYFGVERPKDVPVSIQDRAYTSPIWYTP